jgi:integrase/recombinase XerC
MAKVTKIKYFTPDRLALISDENKKIYEKYLTSSIMKNRDVKDTTYKVYQNYMNHFMVFIAEEWNNINFYSEEFMDNAVDIMESYIYFCQEILKNNKKVINTKISTVSSFYLWSMKRRLIPHHPFDKKLDRMKGANDEKIINHYYLNDQEIQRINEGLLDEKKYDIQDNIIWSLMLESANRVGAISKLTLSSMDLDSMMFNEIREKRGYRVEVTFMENTKSLIEEWLEIRKSEMDNLEIDALFITKYHGEYKQMTYGTIQDRVRKIGRILGLEDFHCHCIRKTSLNEIYEKTGDLALAADMANHKSVETTRASYIKPKSKTETRDKILEMKRKMAEEKNKKQQDNG